MNNNNGVKVIGLTGQSGAGKTTVSQIFKKNGFSHINADTISREVLIDNDKLINKIRNCFGESVINQDNTLNRKNLADIVFKNRELLNKLNEIIYPYIIERINNLIDELSASGEKLILLDAPTLFEAKANEFCNIIVSVIADEEIRLKRIQSRDNISVEQIKDRFSSQKSQEFFIGNSDYIIENNKSNDELVLSAENTCNLIKERLNISL